MRHGDKQNNLGRKAPHRRALLANLTIELIRHKRIVTTLAKAKALRVYAEPLLTKSKDNSTHQRRVVFSYLQNKEALKELFDNVGPKIAARPGGYTRIIKLGTRQGDNAEKAMIELVDYNEIYGNAVNDAAAPAKKTRRAGSKKAADASAATTNTDANTISEISAEPVVAETAAPVAEAVIETVAPVAEVEAAPVVEEIAAPVVETVVETAAPVAVVEAAPEVEEIAAPVVETVVETAAPVAVVEAVPVVEEIAAPVVETVVETAVVEVAPIAANATNKADDLKIVEGIGPKIEELLHAAGILTFDQLANASYDTVKEILNNAGSRYTMHDPTTWGNQAALARDGKMDELKKLQDELKGGKA
jgi:large subunit ribosomal protein L17